MAKKIDPKEIVTFKELLTFYPLPFWTMPRIISFK